MEKKNFEYELPAGYTEVKHLNATSAKLGTVMNLIAIAVTALVVVIAALFVEEFSLVFENLFEIMIAAFAFSAACFVYIVLHELTHGAAYKLLTKQKLTFGLSWSCAFCGVPHIYTYKRTAMIAVAAPLTLFTLILGGITAALYFVSPIYYLFSAVLFGLHLGGCSGDIYVIFLLLKYKTGSLLMRDTGPEQFFYIKNSEN